MHDDDTKKTTAVPDTERGLAHDAAQGLVTGGGLAAGKLIVDGAVGALDAIKDHFANGDRAPTVILPPGVDPE